MTTEDEDRPVPLGALRKLRAGLARLARKHPHLVDGRTRGNADAWHADLKEAGLTEAGETRHVGLRLDAALVDAIDGYATRVQRRTGVKVSRTAAASALLSLALEAIDQVDADPLLTGEPGTVRELVALALEGVAAARTPEPGRKGGRRGIDYAPGLEHLPVEDAPRPFTFGGHTDPAAWRRELVAEIETGPIAITEADFIRTAPEGPQLEIVEITARGPGLRPTTRLRRRVIAMELPGIGLQEITGWPEGSPEAVLPLLEAVLRRQLEHETEAARRVVHHEEHE